MHVFTVAEWYAETMSLLFLSVTFSMKSTKFGNRNLVDTLSEWHKIARLIDGALLYIIAKMNELWPRESPWGAKILNGVLV